MLYFVLMHLLRGEKSALTAKKFRDVFAIAETQIHIASSGYGLNIQ